MKYDFETLVDRSKMGSSKWLDMKNLNPEVESSVVPFSVADMEFKNAPEIIEGLKGFLDTAVLGYTVATHSYLQAVCNWMEKRHGWKMNPEWIVSCEGVVSAIYNAVRAFTKPGEGIIIMTPVYYPFYLAMQRNNRKVVRNQLIHKGDTYLIDFDDLEKKAQDANNTVLLFCSPHNPVGRVWTKEELERIGHICTENNVLIISDEIHSDLILPGYTHTVFATLSDKIRENCIVCTAPSKTFNLAGMHASNIVIPNEKLREQFVKGLDSIGFFSLSIFGYKACEIAYTQCEKWLDDLISVIDNNRRFLTDYIVQNIPQIKVIRMEGTYLMWLDCRGLGMEPKELESFMTHKAQLFLHEGYVFGDEGNGFERINLACPIRVLEAAMKRLSDALEKR